MRTALQILDEGAAAVANEDSPLVALPEELFLQIAHNLDSGGLICLSLTSKALAFKTASYRNEVYADIAQRHTRLWSSFEAEHKVTRALIGRYLGREKYRYCHVCEKFRPVAEKFWYDLFEYNTPSFKESKESLSNLPQHRMHLPNAGDLRTKIEQLLDFWATGGTAGFSGKAALPACPAHIFGTKDRRGIFD
jgi:hypothetical protein